LKLLYLSPNQTKPKPLILLGIKPKKGGFFVLLEDILEEYLYHCQAKRLHGKDTKK
jgi:hypothetical protein